MRLVQSQNSNTKMKRIVTGEIRKTRWLIFFTGYRISKKSERHRIALTRVHFSGIRSTTSNESGNEIKVHSMKTHLPKDRNCDVCLRTEMTRAPCRRRTGEGLPRSVGDLTTADLKLFNEGCESRDNLRCAVVMQDLASQWIQSFSCESKSSHETERSLSKFLEPSHRPRVVKTENSMEFGKACEDLPWNQRTSTLHRSERNGIAERVV